MSKIKLLWLSILFIGLLPTSSLVAAPQQQQTETPTPTMTSTTVAETATATATMMSTETPIPSPTIVATPIPATMAINTIEPTEFGQEFGGTLTVLGSGFTSDTLVRLVGFGVLSTSFISESTLQAAVPAGIASGSYTVELFNSTQSATAPGEIRIQPPAPVGPTATPQPGDLSVGAVEPSEVVKATGTTITVFGGGFTPDAIVRLVGVGALETLYLSDTTLKAVVPPDLPPFRFDLQVIRGNDVATWGGKVTIFIPPTATPVAGSGGTVLTNPQLLIQNTAFDRAPIRPGESFLLTFDLVNVGGRDAKNIVMSFNGTEVAVPAGSSNTQFFDQVIANSEQPFKVAVPLVARSELAAGQYNMGIDFQFLDNNGRGFNTTQTVGISVGDAQPTATPTMTPTPTPEGQPQLILSSYEVNAPIEPGSRFMLDAVVENVGNAVARNVSVTFGGDSAQLAPFALLNAGNVEFIEQIPIGGSVMVSREMITNGDAAAQPYTLALTVEYEDAAQNELVNPFVLSLLVENLPNFQITFYRQPALTIIDQPVDLPVEIVNIGSSIVNVNTIELETDPQLDVENGSIYSGPLDGGTSITLDGVVFPESAGELGVDVIVNYLDDFNQQQQLIERLTLTIDEPDDGLGRIDPETGLPLDPLDPSESGAAAGNGTQLAFQIGGALLALIFIFLVIRAFRRRQ